MDHLICMEMYSSWWAHSENGLPEPFSSSVIKLFCCSANNFYNFSATYDAYLC